MRPSIAWAVTLLSLAVAAPLSAQTAAERARLDWIWERGSLLYALDRAAWVGSDDMMEQIPNAASAGMRGYIVERDGPNHVVTFFGGPREAPVAFYRGRVENGRVAGREVFPAGARPPLTAMQRRLAAVRDLASRLERERCEDASFNTVVIPPAVPEDPVDLYLLTPQLRPREWPFGGHYRVTVAGDGTVTASRAFTTRCITLGGGEGPDEDLSALYITHVLDPIPTEIHVFTMWASRLPIGVGTADPDRSWWIGSRGIILDEPSGRN